MTHERYLKPHKNGSNGSSCCKPCPDCGCLECLCRPRFFAGQLLTEEDLNRLDHYIVEKNKLHNRFLHGWGVVCGLEVLCHPCDGFVTLRAGYALSPCGEDIIVCKDEKVDICSLLDRCKAKHHEECEPPRGSSSDDCQDAIQEWILAIRYVEKPSRGVMALRGSTAPPCCSRCNCGGSSSCGCGCHEAAVVGAGVKAAKGAMGKASSAAYRTYQRTGLNQCEPAVICEGYEFDLYKAPVPDREAPSRGAMFERFERCIRGLLELEPPLPQAQNQLREWCSQLKENWLEFFRDHPLHDCLVDDRLAALQCPEPTSNQTPEQYRLAVLALLAPLLAEFIRSCLCSALLPACPCPVEDNRVPLATITIRKRDCKILRVCNWGPRKFVITFPNLAYWFSFIPFGRTLRQLIERICCRPFRTFNTSDLRPGTAIPVKRFNTFRMASAPVDESQDFARIVYRAFATRGSAIDAQTLFLGAMEVRDASDQPLLADAEVRNPLQYLLLNQVLVPAVSGLIPDESRGTLRTLAANAVRLIRQPRSAEEDVRVLKTQVDDLQNTVRRQQRRLDELISRLPER